MRRAHPGEAGVVREDCAQGGITSRSSGSRCSAYAHTRVGANSCRSPCTPMEPFSPKYAAYCDSISWSTSASRVTPLAPSLACSTSGVAMLIGVQPMLMNEPRSEARELDHKKALVVAMSVRCRWASSHRRSPKRVPSSSDTPGLTLRRHHRDIRAQVDEWHVNADGGVECAHGSSLLSSRRSMNLFHPASEGL